MSQKRLSAQLKHSKHPPIYSWRSVYFYYIQRCWPQLLCGCHALWKHRGRNNAACLFKGTGVWCWGAERKSVRGRRQPERQHSVTSSKQRVTHAREQYFSADLNGIIDLFWFFLRNISTSMLQGLARKMTITRTMQRQAGRQAVGCCV